MKTKLHLLALALIVAIFSVQCSQNNSDTPELPTSVEQHFKAGSHSLDGETLKYQECAITNANNGKYPLVVVLHGQYANGSDNLSQIHQDAVIRIWHYFSSNNIKANIIVPQCPAGRAWDENPAEMNKAAMSIRLKAMIDDYISKKPYVDLSRIYIMGYSDSSQPAGAGGVWRMLSDYTELFASGITVAADPDESIVAKNVARTAVLSIKGVTDVYAVSATLDSFGDEVRDAGGILREEVLNIRSREELCREAFSAEHIDWVLQFTK